MSGSFELSPLDGGGDHHAHRWQGDALFSQSYDSMYRIGDKYFCNSPFPVTVRAFLMPREAFSPDICAIYPAGEVFAIDTLPTLGLGHPTVCFTPERRGDLTEILVPADVRQSDEYEGYIVFAKVRDIEDSCLRLTPQDAT